MVLRSAPFDGDQMAWSIETLKNVVDIFLHEFRLS